MVVMDIELYLIISEIIGMNINNELENSLIYFLANSFDFSIGDVDIDVVTYYLSMVKVVTTATYGRITILN